MQSVVKCLLVDDAEENLLALLDVQMPEMDGFELAERMRVSERTRHVPLIFVTAGAGDERRLFKGYDAGAVEFLHKPIEPRVLESKAQTFFQLQRQRSTSRLFLSAVSNLIGNALQHGENGEPIRVRVDGTRPDEVEISISNTGVIPVDVMTRLFEPFHGGQRESGRRGGMGLGLFIVQQIVQAHGGAVEVRSREDNQTCIRVTVPRRSVAANDVIDARARG